MASFEGWYLEQVAAESKDGVDFACQECGARRTVSALWNEAPLCCDWDMLHLAGTLPPKTDDSAGDP
ncbi:MAG: hypothetical protein LC720_08540 [Actinobacteria bacterium]|nr:hypothetical protein [Actinomycetota bacterium]